MTRALLVDGDLYAYRAAAAVETPIRWRVGDGEQGAEDDALWTLHSDADEAAEAFDAVLSAMTAPLAPDRVVLALSEGPSWRTRLSPDYKAARAARRKPLALPALRDRLRRRHEVVSRSGLEADDVIGLMLTEPSDEERICLSGDKDLRGVPGLHATEQGGLARIDRRAADRWHLVQALAGDPVDGYAGCPGVGRETAEAFLDAPYELRPARRLVQRGARRGQAETRWEKAPCRDLWRGIVSLFARAGLTEADALTQCRLARILRHGEVEPETFRPILWRPSQLRR